MADEPRKNKLWLTIEVPDIYCDDFHTLADDGWTPLDCLFDGIREQVTVTLMLHGDEQGPELMAYSATIIDAHAEPIKGADQQLPADPSPGDRTATRRSSTDD